MQSNTLKIVLSVIITAILVGGGVYFWQNPQLIASEVETYSSEEYSFDYPSGYSITVPTESFPVLTVEKAQNKKVEIFQMKDFGDRPWGFEGDETQEEIDGYVPRETFTIGSNDNQYDVWLYYNENDTLTKKELTGIFESIEITPITQDYTDLTACGNFETSTGDGGPTSQYFVCRASNDGQCYYKKSSSEQILGCDPEFDKNPYGNQECFQTLNTLYSFDGTVSQNNANSNDTCSATTQAYFESKVSE